MSMAPVMSDAATTEAPTSHQGLLDWVNEMISLCQPDSVRWSDGSQAEWDELTQLLVDAGTFTRLNPEKRPNSFLARSSPSDVARVEDRTFICSEKEEDAGPTNNWANPSEIREKLKGFFSRRKQDAPGAVELLLSMKPTHGTAPDVCSYATALAACREAERYDDAP